MRKFRWMIMLPAAAFAVACGRDSNRTDDALRNDLALASQAQPYNPQFNPAEAGYANPYNPYAQPQSPYPYSQYGYPQRVQTATRASAPARRTSTRSSGTIYRAPQEPIRNTKRDAVIGAAAGAVLGASTSRDKLKGAIIGAAAGGLLGGIIGHTVDVKQP
jgi:YmgG-like glycine-zipper protein